ncbi:hypothetical protein M5D96_007070 [Drosophila gunungcola]|uniref:SET domain-containing protein SmydA-8 n=1 Tax=Drosophila gunungcola TaxID=103775 RepID=A0A9Q0BQ03_9MUSC|nr:hypothetical protein M5D96_007070 [Drosophila gunungcola]
MQDFGENIQQAHNEKLGRHLVAAINIEPGDTLLEERPLLVAPHWECHQLKCAQCLQESYVMCRRCQVFPLCMDCGQHDDFECEFFASGAGKAICKDILVKNYGICGLLKLLLLLDNPETKGDCQGLVETPINLSDYRDGEGMWQEHEELVVRPLMESGLVAVLPAQQLTSDTLHAHCIRIDSNSFEVTARDGDTLKGVFVCGASLPHSCVPNTVVALDEQFNMKLYAAVCLQPGDIIYNSYTNPLMGTSQRQHQLRLSRRLECSCSRCLDPTEMGTHMSSMKCRECEGGFSVCEIEPNGRLGDWRCPDCGALLTAAEVHELQAEVGAALVEARGELQVYESLLTQYGPLLHPNHFMLLDIKQNIASILRAAALMNSMEQPCKKLLARRVELCSDLLPVCRAVVPGISKLYAIGLFEYLLALVELVELQFAESDLNKKEYAHLRTASLVAKEAMDLLRFEPENSAEGYLSDRIAMELERIESDLKKYGR